MTEKRLNILHVVSKSLPSFHLSTQQDRIQALQAKFERLWHKDPEQFNPLRNCLEVERLERTWQLLTKHFSISQQKIADIGCGAGFFSRRLRDKGGIIEAVDIAANALKKFKEEGAEHIQLRQAGMPLTHLEDENYQAVVCTELIAEMAQEDYRLFFAELCRILHPDGYLICSSAIDIDTLGGVERLIQLAQSEFDIIEDKFSYHALYLRLERFLKSPSRFVKSFESHEFKQREQAPLKGFSCFLFKMNTSFFVLPFWYGCYFLTDPLLRFLKNNRKLLLLLEKISYFFWAREATSHYLFIAKKRRWHSFNFDSIPEEKAKRKEIWN